MLVKSNTQNKPEDIIDPDNNSAIIIKDLLKQFENLSIKENT